MKRSSKDQAFIELKKTITRKANKWGYLPEGVIQHLRNYLTCDFYDDSDGIVGMPNKYKKKATKK